MSQGALMATRWSGSVRKPPGPQRGSSSSGAEQCSQGSQGMQLSPTVRTARQQQHHSGNWNVEVVRGKVTTRCFWNACKAFSFGVALMIIGTSMAIVGYYADQLSIGQELRGNTTVHFKNESRGFHLNNLSYAGPIVMGCGGFIVVAACVMTFEARDSAAKVVPARPKYSGAVPSESGAGAGAGAGPGPGAGAGAGITAASGSRSPGSIRRQSARRSTAVQTRGNGTAALHRSPSSRKRNHDTQHQGGTSPDTPNRRALTAAFVQFSRSLQRTAVTPLGPLGAAPPTAASGASGASGDSSPALKRSPSAPDLMARKARQTQIKSSRREESRGRGGGLGPLGPLGRMSLHPSAYPPGLGAASSTAMFRQALSVDCPDMGPMGGCYSPPSHYLSRQHSRGSHDSMEVGASAGASGSNRGSQASMAMDLHLPNDCPVTLRVRDQSHPGHASGHASGHGHGPPRRSDTARRHMLTRQRPVEAEATDAAGPSWRTGAARSLEESAELNSGSVGYTAVLSRHASVDVQVQRAAGHTSPRAGGRRAGSPGGFGSRLCDPRSSSPRLVRYADEEIQALPRSRANSGESGASSAYRKHRKLRTSRSTAEDCDVISPCCGSAPCMCCPCQQTSAVAPRSRTGNRMTPASRRQSSRSSTATDEGSRRQSVQAGAGPSGLQQDAVAMAVHQEQDDAEPKSAVIDMAKVEAQLRNQQDELHRALEAHKRRREERLQQMMPSSTSSGPPPPPPPPPPCEEVALDLPDSSLRLEET